MTEGRAIGKDCERGTEFAWDDLWSRVVQRRESRPEIRVLEITDNSPALTYPTQRPPWFFSLILLTEARRPFETQLSFDFIGHSADEIVPQVFDEIVIHFQKPPPEDPVRLLYSLFRRGFIREKTFVSIVFPKAAVLATTFQQARGWLTGAKAADPSPHELMHAFLEMLRFREIRIREDASLKIPRSGRSTNFLLAEGLNSDFAEFMHERYIPGTWTEISDYEHVPRYLLARRYGSGKRVLDFACGVGFGSLILAESASSVLAVDISRDAVQWGERFYQQPNLHFAFNDDLAASLPPKSFDLVVCFEVIEHLATEHQTTLLKNLCRLLADGGLLLVSTPNPKATELYNSNPFHLAELRRDEFENLLRSHFRFVEISEQKAVPAILFSEKVSDNRAVSSFFDAPASLEKGSILNWIAVCSKEVGVVAPAAIFLDPKSDLIRARILSIREIDELRLRIQEQATRLNHQKEELRRYQLQVESLQEDIRKYRTRAKRLLEENRLVAMLSRLPLVSVIVRICQTVSNSSRRRLQLRNRPKT